MRGTMNGTVKGTMRGTVKGAVKVNGKGTVKGIVRVGKRVARGRVEKEMTNTKASSNLARNEATTAGSKMMLRRVTEIEVEEEEE